MAQPFSYAVKRSPRARALRVSVYQDGRCVVSAPTFVSAGAIESFVDAKARWVMDALRAFMPFRPIVRRPRGLTRAAKRAAYLRHRDAARALIQQRLPELNVPYGFRVGRIAIRDQKSRWGSCSAKGNLNFNYRLALIPERLADYVVHELCHLGQMNHSRAFWDLVARTMPDWKERRDELHKIDPRAL